MNENSSTSSAATAHVEMDALMDVIRKMVGELHPKWKHIRFLPNSHLERDLGLDSMARLELRTRIENHFNITLDEKVAISCVTPTGLLKALLAPKVNNHTGQPHGSTDPGNLLLGSFGCAQEEPDAPPRHTFAQWLYALYAWPVFIAFCALAGLLMVIIPFSVWRNRIAHSLSRLLFKATFTPLSIQGLEHLNHDRPQVVVANHASYLDGFAIIAALDIPFHFIVKGELSRRLPIRLILQRFGVEFIDRFNPQRSAHDVRRITHRTRGGLTLVFFPEGTFITFPGLQPFRMGAFITAARSGVSVVPVAIRGTREIVRGQRWFPVRGEVEVIIRPPVTPAGESWQHAMQLRDAARREISAYCGEPDLVTEAAEMEPG